MLLIPKSSFADRLDIPGGVCELSYALNVDQIVKSVGDDAAGATAGR